MIPDELFAVLERLSASERVFFAIKEEIPFGGECQIMGLSKDGFWVSFEGGFKAFFWRLDIDGMQFEEKRLSSLSPSAGEAFSKLGPFASGLQIVSPDGRRLLLMGTSQ